MDRNPIVENHSEAYDKIVAETKGRLRAAERELVTVQKDLYGNNIALMSDGKRGKKLSARRFHGAKREQARLKKTIASIRKELKHLGVE